jgi:hypothetical protein
MLDDVGTGTLVQVVVVGLLLGLAVVGAVVGGQA